MNVCVCVYVSRPITTSPVTDMYIGVWHPCTLPTYLQCVQYRYIIKIQKQIYIYIIERLVAVKVYSPNLAVRVSSYSQMAMTASSSVTTVDSLSLARPTAREVLSEERKNQSDQLLYCDDKSTNSNQCEEQYSEGTKNCDKTTEGK